MLLISFHVCLSFFILQVTFINLRIFCLFVPVLEPNAKTDSVMDRVFGDNLFFILRFNILNGKLEAVVLDNRYYAGGCLPHFIQDVRYRKPYNIQQYTIEVLCML